MGIITQDHLVVRHSCGIDERMMAEEYATGSSFGHPAPLNGFMEDHMRWAWPGTVSQTVYQAYCASRSDPTNPANPLVRCELTDPGSGQSPKKAYNIDALGFDAIWDSQADPNVFKGDGIYPPGTVFPLVVKPCPMLESPIVRDALHRVADQATAIHSHYRFFAYTIATIGTDPNYYGPAAEVPNSDPAAAFPHAPDQFFPVDSNDRLPATVIVPYTNATVCSSFVWTAVQLANQERGAPKIVLDFSTNAATPGEPQQTPNCQSEVQPDWAGDVRGYTEDGLYVYTNEERQLAARALHDNLYNKVESQLDKVIPLGLLGVVKLFSKAALAAAAASGPGALATLLVLDDITGANLYETLFDMPDDVSNQLCNCFASDYCDESATDSDNWQNPESVSPDHFHVTPTNGSAVSPDNIMMFWDPPLRASQEGIIGLYGYNEKLNLRVGTVKKPVCKIASSGGPATVRGTVKYKGGYVVGAVVTICCEQVTSQGERGFFELTVPAGRYLARASFMDKVTGWGLDGQTDTGNQITPGSSVWIDIELQDPPADKRRVVVTGTMDLTDVYLTGHNENTLSFVCPPLYAEHVMKDLTTVENNVLVAYTSGNASVDEAYGVLEVWLDSIDNNLSVKGHFKGSLPNDDVSWGGEFALRPEETKGWNINLDSGGPFPNRAAIRFTITNIRQS
jgi:hypothetical protein